MPDFALNRQAIGFRGWIVAWLIVVVLPTFTSAAERVLDAKMHPLQLGDVREWDDSPASAEGDRLRLTFTSDESFLPRAIRWRQVGIKGVWKLQLNGRDLARLTDDPLPQHVYFDLPAEALRAGENELLFVGQGKGPDDVQIGDVRLDDRPRKEILNAARLRVTVLDAATGQPLPARITIVDGQRVLASVGASSDKRVAVRPGVVYTLDGQAEFGVPAGKYTIYAGHGLEYGIDSCQVDVSAESSIDKTLTIAREVTLPGYVSCDPHVHTWTYSRHGDCTLQERLITLAAEGIALPIVTDHNVQIDYRAAAGADHPAFKFFTPVVGNEVTTKVGHFNVFPLDASAAPVDHKGAEWASVFGAIGKPSSARVVILNHPRDIHAGFRPFAPKRFISCAGEFTDGWSLQVNAMELVNSGTLQSDPLRLVHDWLGLLNAGHKIAPIGSSDSHDVSRFIVGQGRTYVRLKGRDPGNIDVAAAVKNIAAGHTIASLGMIVDLTVNDDYGPGDVLTTERKGLEIRVRVLGPRWSQPQRVTVFANGYKMHSWEIPSSRVYVGWKEGVWLDEVLRFATLNTVTDDMHLVAVAEGAGVDELFWPTPRPYQPTSTAWKSYGVAVSGPVFVDWDGTPGYASPADYARQMVDGASGDMREIARRLSGRDVSINRQVAALLMQRGLLFTGDNLRTLRAELSAAGRQPIDEYVAEWKEHEVAEQKP